MTARHLASSIVAGGRTPAAFDPLTYMDGWVAGWESGGISDESAIEQDFEDAAEIIQDLLHQERFGARDLPELDAYERASELIDNAPDAEPFEVRVNGARFYVRETTERDQTRYIGRHLGNGSEGWSL